MADSRPPARRYDEDEVRRILERATELQRDLPAGTGAGMTLVDLEEVAAEVGIDRSLIRRAARELDTGLEEGGPWAVVAGASPTIVLERTLPGEISEDEITEANGMAFADDGTLWIQDHGQWRMIGVTPAGEEVGRFPMHVLSYGYIWNGAVDDRGRFWKPATHSDEERVYPPEEGLHEGSFRRHSESPGRGDDALAGGDHPPHSPLLAVRLGRPFRPSPGDDHASCQSPDPRPSRRRRRL